MLAVYTGFQCFFFFICLINGVVGGNRRWLAYLGVNLSKIAHLAIKFKYYAMMNENQLPSLIMLVLKEEFIRCP